jgi:hypothetical protein
MHLGGQVVPHHVFPLCLRVKVLPYLELDLFKKRLIGKSQPNEEWLDVEPPFRENPSADTQLTLSSTEKKRDEETSLFFLLNLL